MKSLRGEHIAWCFAYLSPTLTGWCSYVRLIITADRVVIPQDGFEQRPQFHGFVTRLLAGIAEAVAARQRREDATSGGGNGSGATGQPPPSPGDDYEGDHVSHVALHCGRHPAHSDKQLALSRQHVLPPTANLNATPARCTGVRASYRCP